MTSVGSTPTSATALGCFGVAALHAALSKLRYGLDPRKHRSLVPWSSGYDACFTRRKTMVRVHPGSLDGLQVLGQHPSVVRKWAGFDSRADL